MTDEYWWNIIKDILSKNDAEGKSYLENILEDLINRIASGDMSAVEPFGMFKYIEILVKESKN